MTNAESGVVGSASVAVDIVLPSESDIHVSLLSVLIVEILSEDVVAIVADSLEAIDVLEWAEIILDVPGKVFRDGDDGMSRVFSQA